MYYIHISMQAYSEMLLIHTYQDFYINLVRKHHGH